MIHKPTVLILGAGASVPYGYPLGAGLVDRIVGLIGENPVGGLHSILLREQSLGAHVDDFHRRLKGSETSSIDDFSESNPGYREIGKLCIAASLTVWGPLPDHAVPADLHWYRYLWERMRQGAATPGAFRQNHLRIVSYNYDRSLERYFASVLHHTYPELAAARFGAAATLQAEVLPVVHLHGSLGESADRAFTVTDPMTLNDLQFYREVAAGIRVVHEDQPSDEYAKAQEWLREAEVICFLGFGYHPTNLKRLDVLGQVRGHAGVFVGGTALGLESAEIARAESLLALGGPGTILRQGTDALLYLRRYASLE
jgi:hypothetical protein